MISAKGTFKWCDNDSIDLSLFEQQVVQKHGIRFSILQYKSKEYYQPKHNALPKGVFSVIAETNHSLAEQFPIII